MAEGMYKESFTAPGGTEVASKFRVSASSTGITVWNDPGTSLPFHSDSAAGAGSSEKQKGHESYLSLLCIQNYNFACGSVWVRNLVSNIKGGT
jgi:hypothetical protein